MTHTPIPLQINGSAAAPAVPPDMPLLWVLRDVQGLTGSKPGCLQGVCGACTVLLDGAPVRSCQTPVGSVAGRRITSIEGLAPDVLQRLSTAWARHHALQCGYCQPGQAMTAAALLQAAQETGLTPDAQTVKLQLASHLCRCGTQPRVAQAVTDALRDAAPARQAAGQGSRP